MTLKDLFSTQEWNDIVSAARERHADPVEVIRDAVLDDLAR